MIFNILYSVVNSYFYQGSDKREGAGAGNWGTTEDDLKAQTEPTEEKPAVEGAAAEEEKAPPAPVEPEEKTLTLEEYYAQRKKSNRNPNARQAEEKVRYYSIEIFLQIQFLGSCNQRPS